MAAAVGVLVACLTAVPADAEAQRASATPAEQAIAHVDAHRAALGLSAEDVDELEVTDVVPVGRNGAQVVYLQQRHQGLDVVNAVSNVVIGPDGGVVDVASRFVPDVAAHAPAVQPQVSDVRAAAAAASALGLRPTGSFSPQGQPAGPERARAVTGAGVSREPIPVRLVYQPGDDGSISLAWHVEISPTQSDDVWELRIDAGSGAELARHNLVIHEHAGVTVDQLAVDGSSYRIFDLPVEAPTFGTTSLVVDPADPVASPFGWHDTNGAAGAESTRTVGNNANAYTDTDANNWPDSGSRPDGGSALVFDFSADLTQAPSTYRPAAVTNLFAWTNLLHDAFYAYGFDEVSGNFQTNNYGHGGLGSDAVRAEAQDGRALNNANFYAPADGSPPRMQMFLWDYTSPMRDADFDNGVIVHEYGHGVTQRLTGGPSTVGCLANEEQGGEGWSDWFSLMLTMEPGDAGTDRRGIGTYLLGQPPGGRGIRSYPYSIDMAVDPRTYDSIGFATVPHGVGSVWAAILWDVTWALVDRYGFDADLVHGSAGNNMAMQLVVDGLKLQPCSPGFVDARDAIILADQLGNGGANECLLWTAFARRGLGASAVQGSSSSSLDNTAAFDVPSQCVQPPGAPTGVTATVSRQTATVAFTAPASNGGGAITSYQATCASTTGGTTRSATGTSSPITRSSLSSGHTYTCSVRALNSAGYGPYSAATTPFVVTNTPGAPTDVTVVGNGTSATVSFVPPATDGGSAITSYQASCSSSTGGTTRSASGATSPITRTDLSSGHTYTCRVRALNAVGYGPYSTASAPFLVPTVPGAPTDVTVARSGTTATVSFTSPASDGGSAITSYQARCSSSTGGTTRTASGTTSPITRTSLSSGHTYTCSVRALNSVGYGPYSTASDPFAV